MKIAVIGAGVVGASVAFRLSQDDDTEVTIIDQGQAGGGTTSTSFAWLNASGHETPREYYELKRAGMQEHFRMNEELDETPWLHPGGNLVWTEDEKELDEIEHRVERLLSWGYAAKWLNAKEVNEHLEPNVAFQDPNAAVAYFPEEGWVDAPQLARKFTWLAEENGARTLFDTVVESAKIRDRRISALQLKGDKSIQVDAVVNAAGPGADQVAAMFGLKLPLAPTSGLLVRLTTQKETLGRIIKTPEVDMRPDGPGHVLLHYRPIDQRLCDGASKEALSAELLKRARKVLPTVKDAEISETLVGVRPMPEDGFSCVGAVSAFPGYYEAVTHSGVVLGPLVGRLLTKEILSGEVDPLIASFRPDRFERNPGVV